MRQKWVTSVLERSMYFFCIFVYVCSSSPESEKALVHYSAKRWSILREAVRQAHFFTFRRPSFSSLFFASLYFYSLSVQSIARQSAAVFFFFFSSSLLETQQQLTSSSHWVWCFLRKTFSLLLNIFGNWKNDFPVSTGGGSLNLCTVWWTFFFSPRNFFLQLKLRINEIMSCERVASF